MNRMQMIFKWQLSYLLLFATALFYFHSIPLTGQKIVIHKKDFSTSVQYSIVRNAINQYFRLRDTKGTIPYDRMATELLNAYKIKPMQDNPMLNYHLGKTFLFTISGKQTNSLQYLRKASGKLSPDEVPDLSYLTGWSYHLNLRFDSAIMYYQQAIEDQPKRAEKIRRNIAECKIGKKLVASPIRVFIDNIEKPVNSEASEYCVVIMSDESRLYFTVKKEISGIVSEQIYYSNRGSGGKWMKPRGAGNAINFTSNNASIGISPDGEELYLYVDRNGGDIFVSSLEGDAWSRPSAKTTKLINSPFHEGTASVSYDKKKIFYVSDNPKVSLGGHDIFTATWNEDKKRWENPQNLGNTINTPFDERTVFAHPDGKTLYFSSNGHETMGDLDIFKSELQADSTWSKPQNLGYPINGPGADFGFVLNTSGKRGYYASIGGNSYGGSDIYTITFRGEPKTPLIAGEDNLLLNAKPQGEIKIEDAVTIEAASVTIFKGTVFDATSKKKVQATLDIWDNEKNEKVLSIKSNSHTGRFLTTLPSGKNYGIAVTAPDYISYSENINIKESKGYQSLVYDIPLHKIAVGAKVILKNIFFETNSSKVRTESYPEVNRMVDFLNENPALKVELSGHTDNVGSRAYNMTLSTNRAEAVTKLLISKGIPKGRLSFHGYAFDEPVTTNDTPEGRQQNRRVEMTITAK